MNVMLIATRRKNEPGKGATALLASAINAGVRAAASLYALLQFMATTVDGQMVARIRVVMAALVGDYRSVSIHKIVLEVSSGMAS
jgi:hypothetical protein